MTAPFVCYSKIYYTGGYVTLHHPITTLMSNSEVIQKSWRSFCRWETLKKPFVLEYIGLLSMSSVACFGCILTCVKWVSRERTEGY